jgi:hypothetical protein
MLKQLADALDGAAFERMGLKWCIDVVDIGVAWRLMSSSVATSI